MKFRFVIIIITLLASSLHIRAQEEGTKKEPLEMPGKAYDKIAPVAVRILCDGRLQGGSGSVVGVSRRGAAIILTACHVVSSNFQESRQDPDIELAFHRGIEVKIGLDSLYVPAVIIPRLQYFDASNDLALLATTEPVVQEKVIKYNRSSGVKPGQLVAAVGFPESDELTLTVGRVTRLQERFIVFDARVVPGNSGGPLIDKHGRMIGLSILTYEGEGYALPMDLILSVADNWVKSLNLSKSWKRQKYISFAHRMIADPVFIGSELALIATGVYWGIGNGKPPPIFGDPPNPIRDIGKR